VISLLASCGNNGSTDKETTTTAATKTAATTAATTAAATTTAATTTAAGNADAVRVGIALPLSGPAAYGGNLILSGIQMYTDRFNEAGGVKSLNGAKIELVMGDNEGKPEIGISELERLVSTENVSAILGPVLGAIGTAIAPVAVKYGVPLVMPCTTSDVSLEFATEGNKYVYRCNTGMFDGQEFNKQALTYLGSKLPSGKIEKMAVIYDVGDWGTSTYKTFCNIAEQLGIEIVFVEGLAGDATDISTTIQKLIKSDADLLISACITNNSLLLARQLYEYKCTIPVFSQSNAMFTTEFVKSTGPASEYIMAMMPWTPAYGGGTEEATKICDDYYQKTGNEFSYLEAWGWLAAGVLYEAVEQAGSVDREAIADALYNIDLDNSHPALMMTLYEGVKFATEGQLDPNTNKVRYNNNNELGSTAGLSILQIVNGDFVKVYPLSEGETDQSVFPIPSK